MEMRQSFIKTEEEILLCWSKNLDYRCEDSKKKLGELGRDVGAIIEVLTFSIRKPWSLPQKKRTVRQERNMKIQFLSLDLKLSSF
jgi:hypothetical protein